MNFGIARRFTLGLVLTGALAGCDTFGNPFDVASGKRSSPDEFKVLVRKPLRMPGTLDLPEPRLGERSPLEPDPKTDAVVALLGVPAVTEPAATSSLGESALLSAANASTENRELAVQLETAEAEAERNKPYEPPSIFEAFSDAPEAGAEDALAPAVEARRLQTEGIASAPVDPDSLPPEEADGSTSSIVEPYYPRTDRNPNNRLPVPGTGPAF